MTSKIGGIARNSRRATLLRTAATALIAASPILYSGAASASVGGIQLTAPTVKSAKKLDVTTLVNGGNLQLTASSLVSGTEAAQLAAIGNFKLGAPRLQGFASPTASNFASQPVQNLLAVPMSAPASVGTFSVSTMSISTMAATQYYDNASDITVPASDTAIDINADPDSIVVTNSGNLTGGGGINVVTGDLVIDSSQIADQDQSGWTSAYWQQLFNNDGTPVLVPCDYDPSQSCTVSKAKITRYYGYATTDHNANQTDASITIGNSGDIAFSGIYGIRAENPAGASIDITSSGDISATSDTLRRVGIYAKTKAYYYSRTTDGPNLVAPGDFTYNAYGQLTDVISPTQYETNTTRKRVQNDIGSIHIENSGTIDMGEVVLPFIPYGAASEGIAAYGYGGIDIVNSGTIKVGDLSRGISTASSGNVTITNSGNIEVGNQSTGMASGMGGTPPFRIGDDFRIGGDVTIINTGDISGGMTRAEAEASPNGPLWGTQTPAYAVGMRADMLGSNNDYYGGQLHWAETAEYYGNYLSVLPGLENFTSTLVNEGNIALKDGGRAIVGVQKFGEVQAINRNTITVGNGTSDFDNNFEFHSAGIYLTNFWMNGYSNLTAVNEEDGVITTGDDATGISVKSWFGNATAINEGSVIVGNGVVGTDNIHDPTYTYTNPYDRLFASIGMEVATGGFGVGVTATAINSGDITVGDLGVGMLVGGNSFNIYNPGRITGVAINDGDIVGGENSTGMVAGGNNLYIANIGNITIGDKDVSGYNPHEFTQWAFDQAGHGILAQSALYGFVHNDGTITTGDNTVGIFNGMRRLGFGIASLTSQGEDGVIATGDSSVGVRGEADLYVSLNNAGRISVGDNSVGADLTAGALYHDYYNNAVVRTGNAMASNSGIIETGDNSTGVRLTGARYDVEHNWQRYQYPTGMVDHSVTADVLGGALLANSGTIRTGANSTAVEINGYGYYGINLYNVGMIDAGDGTAIKINADNNLGSAILNGGTIVGDILLGDGDDMMLHAQNVDANGQVLSTGNIFMDGHTIDFGGGTNTFRINQGAISVIGGDNFITGDNLTVEMNYAEIDARNDFIAAPASLASVSTMAISPMSHLSSLFSTLTINGDVSGNFRFAADVDQEGNSDKLNITGNVLDGSEIGVVINPVEQLKGDVKWRPINIGGTNDADLVELAGVSGLYADSFIDGEANYDAASGDIIVSATFGLGHMGTAANAAAVSAGNWLASSMSSYGDRNIHAYTGRQGKGLAIWGRAFQDEGRIDPDSGLQDLSFNQITSGIQVGVQWSRDIGAGRLSVGPMATYGTVEANLNANTSSSRGHPWSIGSNVNYVIPGSFYIDATYQRMKASIDLKTPGTVTQATGETDVKGQGFNLEVGYSHKLKNGLVIEPQLQLTHIKVDLDDFQTSDGIYGLGDIDGKMSTVRAGVSVYKMFETSNGAITPLASLSYINAFDSKTELASNDVGFDSDVSGAGYKAEVGVLGRYHAWDFAAKVAFSDTSSSGSIMSPSLSARYSFGGDAAAEAAAAAQIPEVTEATVKFAEAGNLTGAPLAIAGSASDGAQVISASYAQTGAEPTEEKKEEQPTEATPELNPEQAAEPAAEQAGDEEVDVVVTGSIIRRTTNSEATPISVVTDEDMATKGLLTVGDVMKSFTENKGYTEGKASNLLGRFTFGAEEVNFRGLGTGRTLVLVNGRRIADYPLPFGGEQNGADLGTIPYSAIAKVEYLASGASATYGSDAVGGVVNIITKRDMEQTSASLTGGIYQQGFGEMARASVSTGNSFARGSYTIGVEGSFSNEILASQADYFKDHAPFVAGMVQIDENSASGMNSILPPSSCAPLGFEYENDQCVQDVTDTISLSPKTWQVAGFFDGRYDLTDTIELFATGMLSKAHNKTKSNVLFWQGVVADEDLSAASFITRGFSEDELGSSDVDVDQLMWTGVIGAKGRIDLGGKPWYWDTAFSYGSYKSTQKQTLLKEEGIQNWILDGASTVIVDPNQQYTYLVDSGFYDNQLVDNVVRPVQPSDVDGLIGRSHMDGKASSSMLTATLNGDIGDLGFLFRPAKVAVRAEYGHQMTEIDPDQRTLDTTGNGWYNIGSISSKGTRDRWAIGAEVDASVLANLDLTLAGRYDHYSDASDITGRFTGSAKFLYRPTDWLKVRGGFAQSFRAPDMFNIYGVSEGFTYVPDFAAPGCDGGTGPNCQFYPVASTRQADPNLTEEHGNDLGLGLIFNPVKNFTVTVDWYRIKLKDLVITESPYDVMFKEWQCNEGELDASSQLCQDIYDRVIRNGFGVVEQVIVQPINQDNLTRSGIDIRANYSFESETLGQFSADLSYSKVLKFDLTRFAGDDSIDLKYGEPGASQPGNSLGASLSWYKPLTTGKAISAGIYVSRQGRVYNYDHTQFMEPFYSTNLTVGYQLNTRTSARFSVNNLLNAKPLENGSGFWPGYWAHLQGSEALGRSFYLTVGHSFN